MKPANYYASAAQIPDYVEQAIAGLSRHQLYNLVDALIETISKRKCQKATRQGHLLHTLVKMGA